MFMTLVLTYWLFWGISFWTFANFLWQNNHSTALYVIGFFLLGKGAKTLAEVLMFKQREAVLKTLQQSAVGGTKLHPVSDLNDVKENV